MGQALSIQLAIVFGVVSLWYLIFGGYLLKRYERIGARSLSLFSILWGASFLTMAGFIVIVSNFGIVDGVQLTQLENTVPSTVQPVLISLDFLSGLFAVAGIFAWLWFVLQYTRRIGRREKTAIAVIGGGTLLVSTLNGLTGAAAAFGLINIQPDFRTSVTEFSTVFEVLGTSVAIGVGIALLYTTATRHQPFQERTVVGLSLPVVFPWLVSYFYQFALITDFVSISVLYTGALAIGLVELWLSVTRDDLFEQLPASRTVGRQTAFDASDTAIVVVNNAGNVSDLNSAASELFSISEPDSIGKPLESLLPESVDSTTIHNPEPTTVDVPSGTVLEATTTTATDDSGQAIGETIVFTDITDERRRQQRIQVLNRVLRHNLRNDLNVAQGYVDIMTTEDADTEQYKHKVESIFDDLVTIGQKAQRTETVLAADPHSNSSTKLSLIVGDAVASVEADYGEVPVSVTVPNETAVRINPVVVQTIVEELVANAARHSGCSEIVVTYEPDISALVVADDGSGIPSHEISVLDSAEETALEHGSGLGLWLIKWGTDSIGGKATFDTGEDGTSIQLEFPTELIDHD